MKISPFALTKFLDSMIGTGLDVRRFRGTSFIIRTNTSKQANRLIALQSLLTIPVKVSPYEPLNTSKGVVRSPVLKHVSEDELIRNIPRVTAARRIIVSKGSSPPFHTNTFILTFRSPKPPSSITIGYTSVNVDVYIPNPLRCFKCQAYGHHQANCTRKAVCGRCGSIEHKQENCSSSPKCVHCRGEHAASDRLCPQWIQEKEVQKIKFTRNIPYPAARKIVLATSTMLRAPSSPQSQSMSYAAATVAEPCSQSRPSPVGTAPHHHSSQSPSPSHTLKKSTRSCGVQTDIQISPSSPVILVDRSLIPPVYFDMLAKASHPYSPSVPTSSTPSTSTITKSTSSAQTPPPSPTFKKPDKNPPNTTNKSRHRPTHHSTPDRLATSSVSRSRSRSPPVSSPTPSNHSSRGLTGAHSASPSPSPKKSQKSSKKHNHNPQKIIEKNYYEVLSGEKDAEMEHSH